MCNSTPHIVYANKSIGHLTRTYLELLIISLINTMNEGGSNVMIIQLGIVGDNIIKIVVYFLIPCISTSG